MKTSALEMWGRIADYAARCGLALVAREYRHVGGTLTFLLQPPPPPDGMRLLRQVVASAPPYVGVSHMRLTIARNGALLLEMPAREFRGFSAAYLPPARGLDVPIGPLVLGRGVGRIDLSRPETAHLLVVGATGSGKTELLHTLMWQIARESPACWVILDPKPGLSPHIRRWRGLLHPVAEHRHELLDALGAAVRELRARRKERRAEPPCLVVIDEMLFVARSRAATEMLAELLTQGRAFGVHVIAGTQHATRELLGSALIKEQFTARAVLRVMSPQASNLATGEAGFECHTLAGRGDALLLPQRQRVQVARTSEAMLAALAAAPEPVAVSSAGEVEVETDRGPESDLAPATASKATPLATPPTASLGRVGELLERMRAILREDPDAVGWSRNRWQRELFPGESTGGAKGALVSEALALLKQEGTR